MPLFNLFLLTNKVGYRRTVIFLIHREDVDDICYNTEGIIYAHKKLKESTAIPPTAQDLHCPRAGPGQVEAIFAGPDPDPQGRATLSLALAPGRLDPGPVGSGRGRVRADPDPLIFSSKLNFFFQML